MSYPNYSGVDKLIIAASRIESTKESMMPSSISNKQSINISTSNGTFQESHPNNIATAVAAASYLQAQEMASYQHQHQHLHDFQQPTQQVFHELQSRQYQSTTTTTTANMQPHTQFANQGQTFACNQPGQSSFSSSAMLYAPNVPMHNQHQQCPTPKNKHELELYELLKQNNLLEYFGRFIKFGGDDVQQLADADEQEFVEIMELVEMNHKPLHVRRLQKALNKWRLDKTESFLEAAETFRKPDVGALYDSGLYISNSNNHQGGNLSNHHNDYQSSGTAHNDSLRSVPSSLGDSFSGPTSTVARSLFPVSESDKLNSQRVPESPQQYSTPHEVIKNAPKKPRLMDSIVPSDLTKGLHYDDCSIKSTPKRSKQSKYFKRSRCSPLLPREGEHQNLTGYSPPESPASISMSSDSDDSEQLIEVEVPQDKNVIFGANKRKQGLKRSSAALAQAAESKKNNNCRLPNSQLSDSAVASDVAAIKAKATPEQSSKN